MANSSWDVIKARPKRELRRNQGSLGCYLLKIGIKPQVKSIE
jgi:hypothetical protein